MKKLLLISVALLCLFSCTTIEKIKESKELVFIDYGRYAEKGFLFSPYVYNGNFESIGPVEYTYSPGAEYKETPAAAATNYPINTKQWIYDDFDIYKAIDEVYKACIEKGADALIETKITADTKTITGYANPITLPVYKISGFAIKRK